MGGAVGVRVAARPRAVRDVARSSFDFEVNRDGSMTGRLPGLACGVAGKAEVRVDVRGQGPDATYLVLDVPTGSRLPYFAWASDPVVRSARRRALRGFERAVQAELSEHERPAPPRWYGLLPPVPVSPDQAARLAAVIVVALVANAQGSLLTQFVAAAADTFGASDREIGGALALVRAGVLVSLVAAALADRLGRRRVLLICLIGASAASVVSALAPEFGVFVGSQLVVRSLTSAALVVTAIGVVEEAPDGGRAWAVAMLGLALGAGFSLSVFLLPLADLGSGGWRLAFLLGAAGALLIPSLRSRLRETRRYQAVVAHHGRRGRLRQVFGDYAGPRFLALALAVLLVNIFAAPSSQLTNRYLLEEHAFSHTGIAVYRAVALALPGVVGILLGGTLAERWGRRPVGVLGVALGTGFQMAFFLTGGTALWLSSGLAMVAVAAAGVALGALGAELFPTEVRGTSNGMLLVLGVIGSAVGLLAATRLADVTDGLGSAVALTGLAPLLAAALVLPFLPETRARPLDSVSPSET